MNSIWTMQYVTHDVYSTSMKMSNVWDPTLAKKGWMIVLNVDDSWLVSAILLLSVLGCILNRIVAYTFSSNIYGITVVSLVNLVRYKFGDKLKLIIILSERILWAELAIMFVLHKGCWVFPKVFHKTVIYVLNHLLVSYVRINQLFSAIKKMLLSAVS